MINKITNKPFLDVGDIGNTGLSEKFDMARFRFSSLTFFCFILGYIFCGINYFNEGYWVLVCTNIIVITTLSTILALQHYKKKFLSKGYLMCYLVLSLDLLGNMWAYIIMDVDPGYHIIRLTLVNFFILLGASFQLSKAWTGTLSGIFVTNFFICMFYTQAQYLFDNALVVPMILCGIAYWGNFIRKLHMESLATVLVYKQKNDRLSKMLNTDTQQLHRKIEYLYDQTKKQDLNLEEEIKTIAKVANYNLPDLMVKHTKQASSEENIFVNKILKQHPTLTAGELKLAYMLVRNMSTKDIMEATYKTENTVKVYRHRLRKKMEVQPKVSLLHYLKQFED